MYGNFVRATNDASHYTTLPTQDKEIFFSTSTMGSGDNGGAGGSTNCLGKSGWLAVSASFKCGNAMA